MVLCDRFRIFETFLSNFRKFSTSTLPLVSFTNIFTGSLLGGDPTEPGKVQELAMKIRTRKGLKPDVPQYEHFYVSSDMLTCCSCFLYVY